MSDTSMSELGMKILKQVYGMNLTPEETSCIPALLILAGFGILWKEGNSRASIQRMVDDYMDRLEAKGEMN